MFFYWTRTIQFFFHKIRGRIYFNLLPPSYVSDPTSTTSDRPQERTDGGIPHHMMTSSTPSPHTPSPSSSSHSSSAPKHLGRKSESLSEMAESPSSGGGAGRSLAESASSGSVGGGARRKLNLNDGGSEGGGVAGGVVKEQPSGLVSIIAVCRLVQAAKSK